MRLLLVTSGSIVFQPERPFRKDVPLDAATALSTAALEFAGRTVSVRLAREGLDEQKGSYVG